MRVVLGTIPVTVPIQILDTEHGGDPDDRTQMIIQKTVNLKRARMVLELLVRKTG